MDLAKYLAPDVERFTVERLRAIAETAIDVDAPELDERDGDVLVHVAEQAAAHRQRLLEQRLRPFRIALLARQHAEIVEGLGQPCGVRRGGTPAECERFGEQR